MRVYRDLREAYSEIKRDLAKSPQVASSRVQNLAVETEVREALAYTYTILSMPESVDRLIALGQELEIFSDIPDDISQLAHWLDAEEYARAVWNPGLVTERTHPKLEKLLEGEEPSYSYTDRLQGMTEVIAATILMSPNTRRAFWPMFTREDAVRACRMTRVPCTLGYFFTVRKRQDFDLITRPYLHCTYLERSCDFDKFWFTDLWFASRLQREVYQKILEHHDLDSIELEDIQLGSLTHVVLSLHSFIEGEIY